MSEKNVRVNDLRDNPTWNDYEPPFYFEKLYVMEMAELINTDDPQKAEDALQECWIGTFANTTELAKHICFEFSVEYDLEQLLRKDPLGVSRRYIKVDYEQYGIDLIAGGDVSVLYSDADYNTYIWSRY
jgi:hypothetical protein